MLGKLLLISDLEGCAEMSAGKVKQSRFMCNPAFFQSVKEHLRDPANKVAFLGDYFDQGDMVVSSINGIMDVYKYAPERVTIIVGNRDVNKFRLAHELTLAPTAVGDKQWGVWKGFYDTFKAQTDETPLHTRLMTILNKSMGAASPKVLIDAGLDENQAAYLLLKVLSEKDAAAYAKENNVKPISKNGKNTGMNTNYVSFVNNCRNLFRVAKIVHYDADFKTLMSHAGGMDSFFFHTSEYYDSIKLSLTGPYFDQMEMARKALMTTPKPAEQINTFDEETYNAPLTEVVKSILGSTPNGELPPTPSPSPCYFLLQALGLKPDGTNHFTSFIQSCDNTGCKGPVAGDSGEMYSGDYVTFQKKLKAADVNVVASGHVPHCAPVPLVYKRSDDSGLLFVLNDTSNGYRPADRGSDSAAVTYVTKDGLAAGVMTIGPPLADDPLGFMFGEWTLDTAPLFNIETKSVEFPASRKMLTFPARLEKIPPGIFKPAVVADMPAAGGKRSKGRRSTRKAKAKKSKASRKH